MQTLFKNIKELIQVREPGISFVAGEDMKELPTIKNAFLLIENGLIKDYGVMENCPEFKGEIIDLNGSYVFPSWCDSHSHLVYAGNREGEFVDRINGMTYEEIANRGGGILNSAATLQATSEDDLYLQSKSRLESIIAQGTGALEIKSGYGLTLEAELKMLRVIKRLKESYNIPIKATYLAAHALPLEFKTKKSAYLDQMLGKVLKKVSKENLAEFIDVFCEQGYFDVEDTIRVMEAGKAYGLEAKIHVNQFNPIGGVQAGVDHQALSVDHLEELMEEDIKALQGSKTMPVALPACSFFLSIPYTPARRLISAGLPLALATDYNPGSSPCGNMNFVVSTACIKMKMTPEEAINAATINGAYAMNLCKEVGSITRGKKANFFVTKAMNSYAFLPYSFTENHIDSVYVSGEKWN